MHEGSYRTDVIDAFLLSRRVGNCTAKTVEMYQANLPRFVQFFTEQTIPLICVKPMFIEMYLDNLRRARGVRRLRNGEEMATYAPSASTVHQHYRCLKTFFNWCVETELLKKRGRRGNG